MAEGEKENRIRVIRAMTGNGRLIIRKLLVRERDINNVQTTRLDFLPLSIIIILYFHRYGYLDAGPSWSKRSCAPIKQMSPSLGRTLRQKTLRTLCSSFRHTAHLGDGFQKVLGGFCWCRLLTGDNKINRSDATIGDVGGPGG
jgi:hypothetical protein